MSVIRDMRLKTFNFSHSEKCLNIGQNIGQNIDFLQMRLLKFIKILENLKCKNVLEYMQ